MSSEMKNNQKQTLMKGRGVTHSCGITFPFTIIIIIIFFTFNSANECRVDVQQSKSLIRKTEQQSVSIPCSVNTSCLNLNPQISWFVFKKDSHYQINLIIQPQKFTLHQGDLTIQSLSKADCGVYYCAAALSGHTNEGAQAIGKGTTLKVSEQGFTTGQVLLVALLVLLSVYSLLILGILICIKTGQFKSVFKRRLGKNENKDFSKQVLFSGVVQELYKRNLPKHGKIQTHYKDPQDKPKGHENVQPNEDVYQNLDE
ncbi:immunoglobulin superfamily member 6 isoform X2 [Danio rerio]|uniref:Si:ch211-139g16.8 n=2 Tax=Danio rerio TaxID=7955 RepID=E9QBF7_DANRE